MTACMLVFAWLLVPSVGTPASDLDGTCVGEHCMDVDILMQTRFGINKETGEHRVLAETSTDDEDHQNASDLAAIFSQIDSNEDGSVDKAKARRVSSTMEHVDKLDGNKDGRIDVVEFESMSPGSIKGKGDLPDRPEESEQVEDEHDANGTIALEELDEEELDEESDSGQRRTCPNDIPIMENGVKLTGKYDYAAGSPFQDVDGFIKNCFCDCEAPSGWTHLEEARRRSGNRRRRGQIGDGQYYIQFMSHWGQWHRRRSASDACRCAKVKKSSGKVHIQYKWNDGSPVQQSLGTCNSDPTDEFTDQDCYYESCLLHDVCLLKFGHSTCTPYANVREAANGWSCER